MTALFADLVDYVRMLAEHDPEVVKHRVDAALAAMDAAVIQYGGTREKFIGDAIFAVFGHPRAHGDDAFRAALCGLAIRASLADPEVVGDEPMEVRIGIATGEVVAAPRGVPGTTDMSLTGPAIVIAARIQALARPGEILLDEPTLRAARDRLAVESRGGHELRGHPAPVVLHALLGDRSLAPGLRRAGRLIGRAAERSRLEQLLAEVAGTGKGKIAVVIGEPGVGKSRLLGDLEAHAKASGVAWTWTEHVSYGTGEPYRYVRHFAQTVADEQGTDSGSLARRLLFTDGLEPADAQRLAGGIAAIAREAAVSGWEAEASYVPADPVEATRAIVDACRRYVTRMAQELGPRVIVIDDFHWTDRSSLPMIDRLVEDAPSLPLLVLVGARPGSLAERYASRGERIDLAGLDPEETAELAADVAGAELGIDDARAVHARTGGNPLFVGETVRAMLDDGTLAMRRGRLQLTRQPSAGMPVTLRALLGARIDALPAGARDALGVASVVGIGFTTDLVAELLGRRLGHATLERLAEAALIVPADGGDSWRFAHALIRDAAYAALLTSRRRALHARLADRLTGRPRVSIGQIAQHRVEAGDHERALPLLEAAATAATKVGAMAEAAAFWRTAAQIEPRPDRAASYRQRAADASERAAEHGSGLGAPASR